MKILTVKFKFQKNNDMHENQNIEYKQSWHDDYLKWVCGFANAIGGVIYIGRDNAGNVVHLSDYARLLEDIPNKIRNFMGIICDVQLQIGRAHVWTPVTV